jgi:hypothetical protein
VLLKTTVDNVVAGVNPAARVNNQFKEEKNMVGKLAFYKGKLMTKEDIVREQSVAAGQIQEAPMPPRAQEIPVPRPQAQPLPPMFEAEVMQQQRAMRQQEPMPQQAPRQPLMFETRHAELMPRQYAQQSYAQEPRAQSQPVPTPDLAALRAEMEQRMAEQDAMAQQEQQQQIFEARQQNRQVPQQTQDRVVTVYLRDNLKLDVEVDGANIQRFVEEINEAIGSQMPFQVGSKTISGRQILFYHIQ